MDRLTRKDMKTDKFAQEVGHTVRFLADHKSYAVIALVVLVAIAGYWLYSNRQAVARAAALADAIHVADAVISATPQPPSLNFATQEEKDKAVLEAYSKVAAEYRGSQEGAIAQLYVAAKKADTGEVEEAIRLYREVANFAPTEYERVAQLALAELLAGQNQAEEAERLLRSLASAASALISKEQAQLALARVVGKRNPAEARKILEPLRDSRATISSAAITALAELPPADATAPAPANKAN